MKNFKKIIVLALAVVVCLTALSVTILADTAFNPTIKISARFDKTGDKLIAAVVTSQPCGAIKGTLTFSDKLTIDQAYFVEQNDDTKKYVVNGNSVTFVILADDMENGDTHWADFYFKVNSVADVTFALSDVEACDVNETLAGEGTKIEDATVTLTAENLQALGAQYRKETGNVESALRFGSKLKVDMSNNALGNGKTAVRCGYIAGFEFKLDGADLKETTTFDSTTGEITAVTTGAINKQAQYYLDKGDNYIIYTYAIKGFGKGTTANGDKPVEDLPIVARPYVIYKDSNGYGIEFGTQISKCYSEVEEISDLVSDAESYEK